MKQQKAKRKSAGKMPVRKMVRIDGTDYYADEAQCIIYEPVKPLKSLAEVCLFLQHFPKVIVIGLIDTTFQQLQARLDVLCSPESEIVMEAERFKHPGEMSSLPLIAAIRRLKRSVEISNEKPVAVPPAS